MQINFNQTLDWLYLVDTVNPPADWQAMLQQLGSFEWDAMPSYGGQHRHAVQTLYTQPLTNHPGAKDPDTVRALDQFQQHFDHNFKQQMLDILFANQYFVGTWGQPDRHSFDQITYLSTHWVATPPHYIKHPWHVDARMQVAFGMIYFTEHDSALHSTWFDTGDHLTRIPSAPGQGWMIVNTHEAKHCGMNDTADSRYSLKWSLDLKVRPYMFDNS